MSFLDQDPIAHAVHKVVGYERDRQVTLGFTPEHDRMHEASDYQEMINRREYDALSLLDVDDLQGALQKYAQIAAIAEAAMYQIIAHNPEVLDG